LDFSALAPDDAIAFETETNPYVTANGHAVAGAWRSAMAPRPAD
jgi:hypothetical protein